jgi:hypothetical protein
MALHLAPDNLAKYSKLRWQDRIPARLDPIARETVSEDVFH